MRPINIKNMMALIEKEPDDQYIRVLKLVFLQALMEIKQLRRKNSQLGGKVARYRKKDTPTEPMQVGPNECDDIICPNCSGIVGFNAMANYEKTRCCYHCGQRLKWKECE